MSRTTAVAATAACGAICGVLLGFPWSAPFAALAPLTLFPLFAVYRSGDRRASAYLSALYIAAAFLVGLAWIYDGAVAHQGVGDYYTSFLALLFECIPYALAGYAVSYLSKRPAPVWSVGVASLWTLCDYWRATSPLGIPYLQMGHALIGTPLALIARFGGTESLTFLCVFAAAALFEATRRTRPRAVAWSVFAAAFAASALLRAPASAIAARGFPVSVYQLGQVNDASIWRYISALQTQPRTAELAVWPESAIDLSRNEFMGAVRLQARARRVSLLVGGTASDATGVHDALEFIGADGRTQGYYAKRRLIPFGEFVPFQALAHVIVPATLVAAIPHLTAGTKPVTFDAGGRTIGALICYESAFPALARDDVRRGANLLVAATNDAWFARASGIWELEQTARLVAIETGTPLVLAGTVGPSGAIDADGRWTGTLPIGSIERRTFSVPPAHPTVYDAIGDLPLIGIIAMVCLACLTIRRGGSV